MKLLFKWVPKADKYATGENLMLNRLRLGGYSWNFSSQKDPGLKWRGLINLPSLKNEGYVYGASEDEVKANCEAVVKQWFCEAVREA